MSDERYPEEDLTSEDDYGYADDDGTMPNNVDKLRQAVVGHRIVRVEQNVSGLYHNGYYEETIQGLGLTLDDGKTVILADTSDCCAHTNLKNVIEHLPTIEHAILGVGTTGGFTKWHIYADLGDVLELEVEWNCGNPFYYGYGFDIAVVEMEKHG